MNGRLILACSCITSSCVARSRIALLCLCSVPCIYAEKLVPGHVAFVLDTLSALKKDNPTLAQNAAISLTLKSLFTSQATPVVLNGSLAHALLYFFALKPQIPCDEQTTQLKNLITQICELYKKVQATPYDEYEKRDKLRKQDQDLHERANQIVEYYWNIIDDYELSLEQRHAALAQIAHIVFWMKNSLKQQFCYYAGGYGFLLLFELAEAVDKSAWDVYVLNGSYGLVLFVPRAYKERLVNQYGAGIAGLGFNLHGKHVRAHGTLCDADMLLRETMGGWLTSINGIVGDVERLFNRSSPIVWNIFLVGHGFPSLKPAVNGVQEVLRPSQENLASMTGVTMYEFLRLLAWFNTINVNALVWQTCFGGGYHAQCVSELFKLVRVGNRVPLRYVPISIAPGDKPTQASMDPDFTQFFKLLAIPFADGTIGSKMHMANELACAWWTKALAAITQDNPIVLLPYEQTFKSVAQVGTIAKQLVEKAA